MASLSTSELELLQPDALRAQLTGDVPANMLQLDLVLPDTWGMQKDVQLPRALGSDLRAAMMFQISRLTPFRPEQVFYDVAARLQLVLRNRVEPLLAQVQRLSGLQVSRIQLAGQDTPAGGSFNLLGRNGVNTRWWRRLNTNSWLVAGVCAAALLAAAMTPLKLRTMMVERKHEIVRLSGELADLREAKLGLDQDLQLLDYTREKKALSGNYALAFSELTRLLPDNTYLNSVKISKGNVQISGLGHDVVKLVDIFNESDVFTNAKFTSAVSRSSNNMDLFSIGMQLRQAVEEE
ncbi:MAG: PilN domain-containing protein [Thiopseudomonas sp.]